MTPHVPEIPAFTAAEYETRIENARAAMTQEGLDAIVLTSEANVEYLSGFETQFAWNTPSRPWYFVLPRTAPPMAIIPEIGESNWLSTSWCAEIRTWPSPRPQDEGIGLLAAHLSALPRHFGKVGFEIGPESRLGMPVSDLLRIGEQVPLEIADCTLLMAQLRVVKSVAEIARIHHICQIAGRSFAALPDLIAVGDSEKEICRKFAASLLLNGADKAPYTSIGSGQGGYDSIIMGPTDRCVQQGDVLILDTGAKYAGYFCDFDRNYVFGPPAADVARVHDVLWQATSAGIAAARPGRTLADVFQAQAKVLMAKGLEVGNIGRFGHGLGKVLTEYPSVSPQDQAVLKEGMVLTIEPSAMYGKGKIMAHEEDIVVGEDEAIILTPRAERELTVIPC